MCNANPKLAVNLNLNPKTSRVRWDLVQLHPEVKHVKPECGVTHDPHVVHPMGCSLAILTTTAADCRRVVAEVAMTIFDKQMEGECLPREDWSPTWTGWTATGSGEERKRAKFLAPTQRMGWGKWGFQSEGETPFMKCEHVRCMSELYVISAAYHNLECVLGEIVQAMGGEEAASVVVPGARPKADSLGRRDQGPTIAIYLPQDVWVRMGPADGRRKIRLLQWLEKTGDPDFSMTGTDIVHTKHVANSLGEEEQLLIVRPGEEWAKSAAKYGVAGYQAPWGKLWFKIMNRLTQ